MNQTAIYIFKNVVEDTEIVYRGQNGLVVGVEKGHKTIHIQLESKEEILSVPILEVRPTGRVRNAHIFFFFVACTRIFGIHFLIL